MTKTLAIFGAGPVLGLSLARRFGREGFRIALVARTTENLDALVAELARDGVEASGFVADVYEPAQIAAAVTAIGRIDAVAFNPGGGTMGRASCRCSTWIRRTCGSSSTGSWCPRWRWCGPCCPP
ncbi:SDR family NAD(P)-dependent oxidoreductase [Amycolatopsis japonica]|uniref:SDR family NAD(P)-dependent oxidoreductase n=1 Tax=Amycolatopsis japonica TaxID=208439 RepID=UPI0036713AA3